MSRTHVVTGVASGIGKATKVLLEEQGHRVIGVDLHDADVEADLSTAEGRSALLEKVSRLADGSLDGVLAIAGVAAPTSLTVRVNYFGTIAVMETLRPLLLASAAPRAALVASFAALMPIDSELIDALRGGDEARAVARADALEGDMKNIIYPTTKRAIAEWVRTQSITSDWAGAGIPLNAVGPGIIRTPMTAPMMETPEGRDLLVANVPMSLAGPAEPAVVARLLGWIVSEENTHVTGQVVFVDGGADAATRGPRIFGQPLPAE